ncbi:MAG: NUDIX domain-containing protein, partial [Myxococcota bacterium]
PRCRNEVCSMIAKMPEFVRVMILDPWRRFLVLADKASPARWNFPGGKIEPGETPSMATRREVFEEVGLVLAGLQLVQESELVIDEVTWRGHFFHAVGARGEAAVQEVDKCAELKFVELDELRTLPSVPGVLYEPAVALSERRHDWGGELRSSW